VTCKLSVHGQLWAKACIWLRHQQGTRPAIRTGRTALNVQSVRSTWKVHHILFRLTQRASVWMFRSQLHSWSVSCGW